jgi:hypothetical protein
MRASDEIVEHLVQRVMDVFQRPLMYGGTAAGVDLILHEYLALWAFVVGRESDFEQEWCSELRREKCGSANFSTRYALNHPGVKEAETAAYVVERWQAITRAMAFSDR